MRNLKKERKGPASKTGSDSAPSRTSRPASNRSGRTKTRSRETETGYAACWLDEHCNNDSGVYKVFRSRGAALDYLTDTVFERAEVLKVDVVDIGGKLERRNGRTCYPLMTREQVRDQLGSGMSFSLVLNYDCVMNPIESAVMWVQEVEIE